MENPETLSAERGGGSLERVVRRKIGDTIHARGWYRIDRPDEPEQFDSWGYGIESATVIAVTETGYSAITAHGHRVWVHKNCVLPPNDKLRHAGPETHKCKPQREPALPAANG